MTSEETIEKKVERPIEPLVRGSGLPAPLRRLLDIFSSLRLTVLFLILGLLLVFIGTIAQVEEGLYDAQNRYFRSFFVWWGPQAAGWKIPIFPGGYFVGGVLLVNLIAAHARRFKFSKKKIGIFVIHFGLVLMLVGQLATDMLSNETAMRLEEGETKNYSENGRSTELVFIDGSGQLDRVVSIPQGMLNDGRDIKHENLPFTVRVKNFFPNSRLTDVSSAGEAAATQGAGATIAARGIPKVTDMDLRDIPSAVVEIVTPNGSLGTWLASAFLDTPQTVSVGGKDYGIALRFARYTSRIPFNSCNSRTSATKGRRFLKTLPAACAWKIRKARKRAKCSSL